MTVFVAYQVRGKIYLQIGGAKCLSRFKQVKGVFTMPRLSKKATQEWDFFINPETGRRTYNSLCRKCKNKCKQSYKAIVIFSRSTNPKEVQKALKIAVNMMTAVNLI